MSRASRVRAAAGDVGVGDPGPYGGAAESESTQGAVIEANRVDPAMIPNAVEQAEEVGRDPLYHKYKTTRDGNERNHRREDMPPTRLD